MRIRQLRDNQLLINSSLVDPQEPRKHDLMQNKQALLVKPTHIRELLLKRMGNKNAKILLYEVCPINGFRSHMIPKSVTPHPRRQSGKKHQHLAYT